MTTPAIALIAVHFFLRYHGMTWREFFGIPLLIVMTNFPAVWQAFLLREFFIAEGLFSKRRAADEE